MYIHCVYIVQTLYIHWAYNVSTRLESSNSFHVIRFVRWRPKSAKYGASGGEQQPQTGGGAGKSWDETLTELASDIAERIPGPYDIEVALLDFPVLYEEVRTTFRWTTACAVFYCFFIYLQLRLS